VALRCSLSRSAVYRAIRSGDLVASRIRSRIRIDVAEVDDWMNRHRIEPPDQATPRKVEGPVVGFRTLIDRRRGSS
jgi:excisionase family DNA binding protein